MSRSPLAYPLNRSADMDGGGASELQTDIMRFMAILSLCLVAIFALVQSIPLAPTAPPAEAAERVAEQPVSPKRSVVEKTTAVPEPAPSLLPARPEERAVVLTRPEWLPKSDRRDAQAAPVADKAAKPPESTPPAEPHTTEGFTLRFESDAALLRAVAAGKVGFYAISGGRARRMAVSDSRISFWDASTPNSFHEMERGTVPTPVVDALGQAGDSARWGVTMPGRMTTELENLMTSNTGGILVIAADGHIRLEGQ